MKRATLLNCPTLSFLRSLAALLAWPLALAHAYPVATLPTDGYAMRLWQTEDGLPQNVVTCAVQTRDGYLWFGTLSGLARFDGERFHVFDAITTPALRDRRISSLFEDAEGTLWIANEAGLITRYRNGQFEPVALDAGIPSDKIIGLGSDRAGRLWAMRKNGALDSLPDGQRLPTLIGSDRPAVMAWSRNTRGNIWLVENGRPIRLVDGKLEPATLDAPPPGHYNYVLCIAASGDRSAWILCNDQVRRWEDGSWVEHRGRVPWPTEPASSIACCLELRDGTLAVGTIYSGLYLIFKDGRPPVHFDRTNGLPQNWIRFLYEDREGNLWAGAGGAGLVSIQPSAFSVLNSPDQWQGCAVLAVAPGRNNSLWIGTDGAALYHYSDGKWSHFARAEGLGNWYVGAVVENSVGDVWAGNFWWGGPFRLDNGQFVRPPYVDEASGPVFALVAPSNTNEILVGNSDGLLQLKNDRAQWLIKPADASANGVRSVALDHQGVIWAGFAQGGLARSADGVVKYFHPQDGLASDAVHCVLADDDGAIWIGTADNGLSRFKHGKFVNLGTAQGLADNAVGSILDDGLGNFWLSTHHGIQRVAKAELNRCADGLKRTFVSQVYDRSDGLPTDEYSAGVQAAGCKTQDGRLWFASAKGALSLDPKRIQVNATPPPVIVESLLVDGAGVAFSGANAPDQLRPSHQRIEVHYTGLSFVAPNKVRFKYRLDGLDDTWVDAGNRRTAYYSQLPAGSYRFRVIASNNDGVWNEEGAMLAFVVAPFFWETWWFIGGCLITLVAGVAWVVRSFTRRRLQRRIEQLEHQHAIERERARIAQDIHDDLGSSLTRISMLSQPALSELAQPQQTAAVLTNIYSTAREVTRAMDEIVWAIDPTHDTLDSLVNYMGKFAQDLLESANIACRLDLPVELPSWPLTAETRHNLFLGFKEVLNNVLKHAGASEVHVAFRLQPGGFTLSVQDNGRGFDPTASASPTPGRPAPGHGLTNLLQRMDRIGGQCEITTRAGQGTIVTLTVRVSSRAKASGSV